MSPRQTTIKFKVPNATLIYPIAGDEAFEEQLRQALQVRVELVDELGATTAIVMSIGDITIVHELPPGHPEADTVPDGIVVDEPHKLKGGN